MKKQWIDENGVSIPYFRITKSEKLKEAICDKLLNIVTGKQIGRAHV